MDFPHRTQLEIFPAGERGQLKTAEKAVQVTLRKATRPLIFMVCLYKRPCLA
jgi:hypothetical protein